MAGSACLPAGGRKPGPSAVTGLLETASLEHRHNGAPVHGCGDMLRGGGGAAGGSAGSQHFQAVRQRAISRQAGARETAPSKHWRWPRCLLGGRQRRSPAPSSTSRWKGSCSSASAARCPRPAAAAAQSAAAGGKACRAFKDRTSSCSLLVQAVPAIQRGKEVRGEGMTQHGNGHTAHRDSGPTCPPLPLPPSCLLCSRPRSASLSRRSWRRRPARTGPSPRGCASGPTTPFGEGAPPEGGGRAHAPPLSCPVGCSRTSTGVEHRSCCVQLPLLRAVACCWRPQGLPGCTASKGGRTSACGRQPSSASRRVNARANSTAEQVAYSTRATAATAWLARAQCMPRTAP